MNTRKSTGALLATLLAGTLALGACVEQRTASDQDAGRTQSQAERAQAAALRQAATFQHLQEVRVQHPTAGLEVPPDDLGRTTPAADTGGTSPLTRPSPTQRHVQ
jgi:hypothetical protein